MLCTFLFLFVTQPELHLKYQDTYTYGMAFVPAFENSWQQLISYQFFHSSVMHLVSNAWYLGIFGWILESALGPVRFLALCLAAGAIAVFPEQVFQMNPNLPIIGSSGAVAFTMGMVALLYPTSRIQFLLSPFPIPHFPQTFFLPLRALIYFWLFLQVSGLFMNYFSEPSPVAYATHLSAFAFGMIGAVVFRKRIDSKLLDVDLMGKDLRQFYEALQALHENRVESANPILAELSVKHPYRQNLQKKIFEISLEYKQRDLADIAFRRFFAEALLLQDRKQLESFLGAYLKSFEALPPSSLQERIRLSQVLKASKNPELKRALSASTLVS